MKKQGFDGFEILPRLFLLNLEGVNVARRMALYLTDGPTTPLFVHMAMLIIQIKP